MRGRVAVGANIIYGRFYEEEIRAEASTLARAELVESCLIYTRKRQFGSVHIWSFHNQNWVWFELVN
jgi:hypothetical protein